jgi:hypothetical protein
MLSFNSIGNLGRLANQMFQYASLKGIARHRGYEFCIPPKEVFGQVDSVVRTSDGNIHDVFDISKNNIGISNNLKYAERMHEFDEEQFNNCPDNVDLFGYYQTEKYFKHIEDEIRNDFTFNEILLDEVKSFFDEYFENEKVISLHIRRGDYVSNPNHPVQGLDYYEKALSYFSEESVIIFSDDPQWCKEQDLFSSDRFSISENNTAEFDLCLMSLCSYHIIANSSFSWWGAWLANSSKVIAPSNWFAGSCANKNPKDMYCDGWIVV